MLSALTKLKEKFNFVNSWSLQTKLIFFSTFLILAAIPVTVVASLTFRSFTSKASGTYGDCSAFGCTGPSLDTSWSAAQFRIRYKCCFSPNFTDWVSVGGTRYTAPYAIFDYEVQIGIGQNWYAWKADNNQGGSSSVSWSAPLYQSQLAHFNDIFNGSPVNACYKGAGTGGGQLPGCVDHNTGTGRAVTFTGLSPNEYYDLYVFVKDSENNGSSHVYSTQSKLGPTGGCINCPSQPPPPSLPSKPAGLNPGTATLVACMQSGATFGGQLNFSWSGTDANQYAVDISENANFSPGFTNKIVTGSTFNASGTASWNNQLYSNLGVNNSLVLQVGKDYYWRVWASNSAGYTYSDTSTVKMPVCANTLPTVPSNLNTGLSTFLACAPAGSRWGTQATFSWSGSNTTKYAVDLADNTSFYPGFANKIMGTVIPNQPTYAVGGIGGWGDNLGTTYTSIGNLNLEPGKAYYWRVYAENSAGHVYSNLGTIFMQICGNQPPAQPTINGDSDLLTCAKTTKWGATHAFSWSGGNGATNFYIDISDSSNFARFANRRLAGNVFATNGYQNWNDNSSGLTANGSLNLNTGTNYYFRIFALNNYGGTHSQISTPFTLTACLPDNPPSPQNTNLPSPWSRKDIGNTIGLGGALWDQSNGSYTVSGSGADIWSISDAFSYAWMGLSGNGVIAATVGNQVNTNGWAKAGLMIRQSTDPNSAYAYIAITPSNGVAFQYRTVNGGLSQHSYNSAIDGDRRPMRLALTRGGNTISGYAYKTGSSPILIGKAEISMPSSVIAGFAVTSHAAGAISKATFSSTYWSANYDSKPTDPSTNLRINSNQCSTDGSSASVQFAWDGPTSIGTQYIVDISTVQNPGTRWSSGNFMNNAQDKYIPRNGNLYNWGNLSSNTVHYWRVYNIITATHSYGKPFVPCNTKPTGAPVSGYISSFFGLSHPLGIDIARGGAYPVSQSVYSTLRGTVVRAGLSTTDGYGNVIELLQPSVTIDGVKQASFVRYAHLASIDPSITVGKIIPWGTYLGVWGQTGKVESGGGVDAIHVHYETGIGPENATVSTFSDTKNLQNPLNLNIPLYTCSLGQCAFSLND